MFVIHAYITIDLTFGENNLSYIEKKIKILGLFENMKRTPPSSVTVTRENGQGFQAQKKFDKKVMCSKKISV